MEKEWKIQSLETDVETGVVKSIRFKCETTFKNKVFSVYGECIVCEDVSIINTSDNSFIDFENLKEDIVLDWLVNNITETQLIHIESDLNKQITEHTDIYDRLPWIQMPTAEEMMQEIVIKK